MSPVARKLLFCPRYFARSFTGQTSTLMLSMVTSLFLFVPWLLRIFALSGWMFSPTLTVLFLESHIVLSSCSRDVENNSTSSANRSFERQSACRSPRLMPKPFSRQHFKSSSSAACRTVLNSKLLSGPPCFVLLFISNTSLSLSVKTVAFWSAWSLFKRLMYCGSIPNCASAVHSAFVPYRVESFREVHCRYPHFDSSHSASLFQQFVRDQMIQSLIWASMIIFSWRTVW